jgi:hypothetical protein
MGQPRKLEWPHKKAAIRRAILVELSSRGASIADIVTLTGYSNFSAKVMMSKLPEAAYSGWRADRYHSTPIDATVVPEYKKLCKKMGAEAAAELVMGWKD